MDNQVETKSGLKSFFRGVLAVFIGLFAFLLVLVTAGFITYKIIFPTEKIVVEEGTILHLELSGLYIDERSAPEDFLPVMPISLPYIGSPGGDYTVGIDELRKAIRSAAQSDKISGILLEAGSARFGWAAGQELLNELIEFKESGKFIISYDYSYWDKGYYLASVADSVYLHPNGSFNFKGLSIEHHYLRGLLDMLEVEPVFFAEGDYKSYPETFMNYERSEEDREQTQELLDDFQKIQLSSISSFRNMEYARLKEISDEFLVRKVEDSLELGLTDGIYYRDELTAKLKEINGQDEDDELLFISPGRLNFSPEAIEEEESENEIAVIYICGRFGDDVHQDEMGEIIRDLKEDDNVKAVVLRIDSGGGSVLTGSLIHRELMLLQEEKPVIASMGNDAASAGYKIAMPAQTVLAQSNTITGSIGTLWGFPVLQGLLENKLGINTDVVKTGEYSDIFSMSRQMTAEEREISEADLEYFYDSFIKLVAAGRDMPEARVRELAGGRVYSGKRALELGLVDEIGGLDRALEFAAEAAGIDNYMVAAYPEIEGPFDYILSMIGIGISESRLRAELGELYPLYKQYKMLTEYEGIQARMPYEIIIE